MFVNAVDLNIKKCYNWIKNTKRSVLFMKTCPKCGELVGTHADVCFKCKYVFYDRIQEIELERQKSEAKRLAEAARQEELRVKISLNDIYEYDVVCIRDKHSGGMDVEKLTAVLKEHGEMGWRLVNTFTNELGVESSGISMRGMSYSTNATIDETILIFERCIKRNTKEEKLNENTDSVNIQNNLESTSVVTKERKLCPECGTQNRLRALKCSNCGFKF